MKRLSLTTVLIIATVAGNWPSVRANGQSNDWITVQACQLSLQLPRNLKRNRNEGIDSCTAEFEDREMFLLLDHGTWGGAATKNANTINFAEGSFVVDGKTGLLATYVMYVGNHRERKYLAHLYVVLEAAQGTYGRPTSLMATVIGRNAKAMDIARRIFQSIRFPTATPNKSLDRSGGSVFCNLIGRAKVE